MKQRDHNQEWQETAYSVVLVVLVSLSSVWPNVTHVAEMSLNTEPKLAHETQKWSML